MLGVGGRNLGTFIWHYRHVMSSTPRTMACKVEVPNVDTFLSHATSSKIQNMQFEQDG